MNHTSPEGGGHNSIHVVTAPEAAAAPTLIETHLARIEFAEALGRRAVSHDPELFERTLVGCWESMEHFVNDFIAESGLNEGLDVLPAPIRPFAVIDRLRVAENLRQELLVLPVMNRVWVFDAPTVVDFTVAKREREAHSGRGNGEAHDPLP